MIKACANCGNEFHARRTTAKFCSTRCRVQAHRGYTPIIPEAPPIIQAKTKNPVEDSAIVINEARQVASAFMQLSNAAPPRIRTSCARVGKAIFTALENEGW